MSHFTKLAYQILTSNDQHALAQMTQAICDPVNLELLIDQIPQSNDLHFIFTEILTKTILNGDFCPVNETKSDDNNTREMSSEKSKLYEMIMSRVFRNICSGTLQKEYIIKSALNLVSACLKDLCDSNKNIQIFVNLMETCFFPSWKMNEKFTSLLNGELTFLQPSVNIENYFMSNPQGLEVYKYSGKILIQLFEYVTMPTIYKTYYDYRRNIYTFKNTYLPSILNIGTEYHKILFQEWKKNMTSIEIINALTVSIGLMEKIIGYPFTLTLHQFESEDENKDSAVGLSSDIYFSPCFRNVLCDKMFLDMFWEFFFFLINELTQFNQLSDTVYGLIKILGRIINTSTYVFNSDPERIKFRVQNTEMVINLLFNFKFFDSFYISSLSDIFCKILNSYTSAELEEKRQQLYQGLMFYCESLIENCPIKLEDGKRNPFNRAFEIIVICINLSKDTQYSNDIKAKAQEILNKAFIKLCNRDYTQRIIKEFGKNQKTQIQCFQELFQHIPIVFAIHLEQNLENLRNLDLQPLQENQSQQIVWLHLCSVLLPNHLANRNQTEIILKYLTLAEFGKNLASLHYIHVLISQVLQEMQNGIPSSCLWTHIRDIRKVDFTDFVLNVLRLCKQNFEQTNTEIIDYALDVFKSVYMKLKKHRAEENETVDQKFNPFYLEVNNLIQNLQATIFENPAFFKRRVQLFCVISTIWISSQNFKYLPEIYQLVSAGLKQELQAHQLQNTPIDPVKFLKYMHDVQGILQPIEDSDCFKIVCELAIQDLQVALKILLNTKQAVDMLFGDEMFLKAFCKMVLQFVTDKGRRISHHIQTELPFQIHDLFRPYLLEVINYNYPRCTVKIWEKFAALHPLEDMLPLIHSFKEKDSREFCSLIKEYFDNVHRVELSQLESLYAYIEDRVEFLCQWWEEIIRRKLRPNVSLIKVVESRIAITNRQKEELAKLIFFVGSYDQKYWNLEGWTDEGLFVKWFLENYKGFKQ